MDFMKGLPVGYLQNDHGLCGTVSVIGKTPQSLIIMSCGHVLENFSGTITIEMTDGDAVIDVIDQTLPAEVIEYGQDQEPYFEDAAFIIVPREQVQGPYDKISYAPLYLDSSIDRDAFLKTTRLCSIGYPADKNEPLLAYHTLNFEKELDRGGQYDLYNVTHKNMIQRKPGGYDLACTVTSETWQSDITYPNKGTQNGMSGGPVLIITDDNTIYCIGMNGVSPPPEHLEIRSIGKDGVSFSDQDNQLFKVNGLWRSSWRNWQCAPPAVKNELMALPEYAAQFSMTLPVRTK
jgi:hypothetical protein